MGRFIGAVAMTGVLLFAGCQTVPKPQCPVGAAGPGVDVKLDEKQQMCIITKTASGLANQNVTPEQVQKVLKAAQKDPQTAETVQKVNSALSPVQIGVKYCPVDGSRYNGTLEKCPQCGATLVPVQ